MAEGNVFWLKGGGGGPAAAARRRRPGGGGPAAAAIIPYKERAMQRSGTFVTGMLGDLSRDMPIYRGKLHGTQSVH